MRPPTSVFTAGNRAFTLLEVLVVLLLLSLIFGTVVAIFRSTGEGALFLRRDAERLYQQVFLTYRLRRQLEGLLRGFRLQKREDGLYLGFITSTGENYRGVVQVRYRYQDGELFYCEKPYPYGDILSCGDSKEIFLGNFRNFKVRVFSGGRWWPEESFRGRPEKVEIDLEDIRIVVPVRVGWVLR